MHLLINKQCVSELLLQNMDEDNALDGSLNLEIAAAGSETPPAEAVAQLHPTSFKAAKDAAEKSMQHPAIKKKMTSALWDVDRYIWFQSK